MKKPIIYSLLILGVATIMVYFLSRDNSPKLETQTFKNNTLKPLDGKKPLAITTSSKINVSPKRALINQAPQKNQQVLETATNLPLNKLNIELTQLVEQGATTEELAAAYEGYGDALVEANQYKEAIEAYKEADEYGVKSQKDLHFKLARTYALDGVYYGSMQDYLTSARELGFRNYRALLYDKAFEDWKINHNFMYRYHELFGNNKKAMFKALVHLGPKKKLTKNYVVNASQLFESPEHKYRERTGYYQKFPTISPYFDDFIEGVSESMFSRGGGDNYRYEMVLAGNNNYVAIVYSREGNWDKHLSPKTYYVATYDKKGNAIATLEIAKKGSLKTCKGFVLHPNNTIEVSTYKIKWKDEIDEKEDYWVYKDLKLVKEQEKLTYSINDEGKILEQKELLLGMN